LLRVKGRFVRFSSNRSIIHLCHVIGVITCGISVATDSMILELSAVAATIGWVALTDTAHTGAMTPAVVRTNRNIA